MSTRGVEHVESLRDHLECPACSYSLRGLFGEDITCPECGVVTNIPQLVARKWTRPWWDAPLYNTIAMPLAWAFLMLLASPVAISFADAMPRDGYFVMLAFFAFALGTWSGWLAFVAHRFGSAEGLWLALLVHAVLPAYVGGAGMMIAGVAGVMGNLADGNLALMISCVLLLAAGVAAMVGGRAIERYIAHRCIRRHLRHGEFNDEGLLMNADARMSGG